MIVQRTCPVFNFVIAMAMEEKLKKWIDFFDEAGIEDLTNIRTIAKKFYDEKIDDDIIQTLTEKDLKDIGVDAN